MSSTTVSKKTDVLECQNAHREHHQTPSIDSSEYSLTLDFGRQAEAMLSVDCVPDATAIRVRLGDFLGGPGLVPNQGWIAQQSFWSTSDADTVEWSPAAERQVVSE